MPPEAPLEPIHSEEPIRFPTLDGVRFLAFFAVFLSHALQGLMPRIMAIRPFDALPPAFRDANQAGGYGVDLFLVLSAFLITTLLMREQDVTGTIRVGGFYVRRMLRIWPLYLVFLAAMFMAGHVVPRGIAGFEPIATGYWVSFLALGGNWYVGLHGFPKGNISPLWSVSLEEQFYLFWPWLLLAFRRHLVPVALAMVAVALAARTAVVLYEVPTPAMWTFTVTRLDPIALGVLLAVANRKKLLPTLSPTWQWALFAGGFLAWPFIFTAFYSESLGRAYIVYPLAALTAAGILLAAVMSTGTLRRFLMLRWVVRLGTLSYGAYVMHYAALAVAGALVAAAFPGGSLPLKVVLGFTLTWAAAEVSYRFLETPFLHLRKRFRPRANSRAAVLASAGGTATTTTTTTADRVEDGRGAARPP